MQTEMRDQSVPGSTSSVAFWRGDTVDQRRFIDHLMRLETTLPEAQFAINLCDDRYLFSVAFVAASLRAQTTLLPADRLPATVVAVGQRYPSHHIVDDAVVLDIIEGAGSPSWGSDCSTPGRPWNFWRDQISGDHIAAISFTSGSTGTPSAHRKSWRSLVVAARLAEARLNIDSSCAIVATVPAQHMYGLETSVMLPLVSGATLTATRPFFPGDVVAALAQTEAPRVLITTPAHLRVCIGEVTEWPSLHCVVSATAPLSQSLAADVERALVTPVFEIYGCTEWGTLATRRTTAASDWQTMDGVTLTSRNGKIFVAGGHLDAEVALSDRLELLAPDRFQLLGRAEDQVNIAGKRASLMALNSALNAVPGVTDAVFVVPEQTSTGGVERLAALVVAPGVAEADIVTALAERIDRAFLPRPLIHVDKLPRNPTGKLPRDDLLALLEQAKPRSS